MPAPAIVAELLAVVGDLAVTDDTIEADTDLLLGGVIDSMGVVAVVGWIEERFGFEVDPADVVLEHFSSVEAMADFIGQRVIDAP